MTKTYIGAKVVQAWPEQRMAEPGDPFDENQPTVLPMLEGYAVNHADGYISWSPKDVFEEAYREVPDEDAPAILEATRDEIDRLANGGLIFDAIGAEDEQKRAVGFRVDALELARGSLQEPFTPKQWFDRASLIADYLKSGVANVAADNAKDD